MDMTPTIAIHMSAALGALLIGPWVLWSRLGTTLHPRLHRALGYAWVTLMLAGSITAIFIRDTRLPNVWGYTPIHLLIPVTLVGLYVAIHAVMHRAYDVHRKTMQSLYWLACVIPGVFTLLPGRLLGKIVWGY